MHIISSEKSCSPLFQFIVPLGSFFFLSSSTQSSYTQLPIITLRESWAYNKHSFYIKHLCYTDHLWGSCRTAFTADTTVIQPKKAIIAVTAWVVMPFFSAAIFPNSKAFIPGFVYCIPGLFNFIFVLFFLVSWTLLCSCLLLY